MHSGSARTRYASKFQSSAFRCLKNNQAIRGRRLRSNYKSSAPVELDAWRGSQPAARGAPECRQRSAHTTPLAANRRRLGGHRTLDTQPRTPVAQPEALTFSVGPQRCLFPSRNLKGRKMLCATPLHQSTKSHSIQFPIFLYNLFFYNS